jgi:hypothetical protein
MNLNDDIAVARAREAGEPRRLRLWPLYRLIPAVPAAWSVTTVAFIEYLSVSVPIAT